MKPDRSPGIQIPHVPQLHLPAHLYTELGLGHGG